MAKTPKLTPAEKDSLIRAGYESIVLQGAGGITASPVWSTVARQGVGNRILVIVELSGGNDGLNTVIPHGDDAYCAARPHLGIRKNQLLPLDDHFGFQKTMMGFERLFKDGQMAIAHGVGYDQPSFSHFSSMAFRQTGAPNSGEAHGWLGRLADTLDPLGHNVNFLVNIDDHQSLTVRAANHLPLVFDDPDKFTRRIYNGQGPAITALDARGQAGGNDALDFLFDIAASASQSDCLVREAWKTYQTPVDYGLVSWGLEKVAALIAADFPTQVYYVPYRNNAFDTHVYQVDQHARLWSYTSDQIAAFLRDMAQLGRAEDVVLMAFSEFGRRVAENTCLGTDHGTAGPAFIIGAPVRGRPNGSAPSLTDLDAGNLKFTSDYRQIYSTPIKGRMRHDKVSQVLKNDFSPLPVVTHAA